MFVFNVYCLDQHLNDVSIEVHASSAHTAELLVEHGSLLTPIEVVFIGLIDKVYPIDEQGEEELIPF